jgi:serine/threonine-protein kinase
MPPVIPHLERFLRIVPINKGWSDDRKYYAETKAGEKRLIRVSDVSVLEEKRREFELMKRMAKAGIPMSEPLEFGVSEDGKAVYQLLNWCDGEEAKELLPSLSLDEQYAFGQEAGRILRRMERIERYEPSNIWAEEYGMRVRGYIEAYRKCGERLYADNQLLQFIDEHWACLDNRPRCLLHADYQSDNMVISPDGHLFIIDFQGSGVVDPCYTLTGVMVTAEVSPAFSRGQLDVYFDGPVPDDFWLLNAFYMATESINAFAVAVKLGREEVEYSQGLMHQMMEWYDNLNIIIPTWYRHN